MLSALLCLGLSACGGGESQTVATVGQSKISKATLNHWMSTVAGGDYHQILGKRAPAGLASEPADYPRCIKAAERVVEQAEASHRPHFSHAQLQTKCRQLHAALKEQALSYLIAVLWRAEEGRELGANVSDREIDQRVSEIRRTEYANPAQFDRYLEERNWTIGDERYLLKRNMLDDKFLARLKAQVAKQGGGQQTLVKLIRQAFAKLAAKTSCSPGYRAWGCKQYGLAEAVKPSPAQLIEYLAGTNSE
jgi:hypothetical protein